MTRNATFGLLTLFVGMAVGLFSNSFGEHAVLLLGTPLLLPLVLLLFVSPRTLFFILIATRCALDPVLESARFTSSFGLGALLNVLVVACAGIIILQAKKSSVRDTLILWVAPLVVMLIGTTYAPDPIAALKGLIAFTSYFAAFAVAMILTEEGQLRKLLRVILWSSVVPLLFGVYQFATGSMVVEGRLSSTFTHPNIYAFYCLLVLIVLLYLRNTRQEAGEPPITPALAFAKGVLLVLLLISITLTQTRSAWLALVLFALIYGLFYSRKTLLGLGLGLLVAAFMPAVQDRVVDLFQGNEVVQYAKLNSFAWRQYIWETGLAWMSPSRYLFGYGIGGFYFYTPDFFPLSGGIKFGAHNVFVERFFDGGLVAVTVFGIFFVAQFRRAFNLLHRQRFAALVYFGLLLSYLTLNASDNVVGYLAYNWYYWAVAGAFYALGNKAARQHKEQNGTAT